MQTEPKPQDILTDAFGRHHTYLRNSLTERFHGEVPRTMEEHAHA